MGDGIGGANGKGSIQNAKKIFVRAVDYDTSVSAEAYPVRKATPLLQPVWLLKSLQTKAELACCFGIAVTTIIVMMPPPITRKRPVRC